MLRSAVVGRVMLGLLVVTASACGDTTEPSPVASAVRVLSGDGQEAEVGKLVAAPVVIRVVSSSGAPVRDQPVTFTVTGGNGTVAAGAAMTNGDGVVQARWTLGTRTADAQMLEVRTSNPGSGQAVLPAIVRAVARAGPAVSLAKFAGDAQVGVVGIALRTPLTVRAIDRYGNPAAGTRVRFLVSAGTGSGSVSAADVPVDTAGIARTEWTLAGTIGPQFLVAVYDTMSVTFTAQAASSAPAGLGNAFGGNQTGEVGLPLGEWVVVGVFDARSVRIAGIPVTFVVTSGGGSVVAEAAVTDANGYVRARWTLGTSAEGGLQTLAARTTNPLTGVVLSANAATATALPGPAASIQVIPNQPPIGLSGATLESLISVRVTDRYRNAIVGVPVTWSADPVKGGAVSPASAVTSAGGYARTTWTLGATGTQPLRTSAGAASATLTGTATGEWIAMQSTTSANLRDVWGSSSANVWAVGDGGAIVRNDGTRWSSVASPTTSTLDRVNGRSATDVYVSGPSAGVFHWDGTGWSAVAPPPRPTGLLPGSKYVVQYWSSASAIAVVNVTNATDADSIMRWNGATWMSELRNARNVSALWLGLDGRAMIASKVVGAVVPRWTNTGGGWTASGGGDEVDGITGKSFDDLLIHASDAGVCCQTTHFNGTGADFSSNARLPWRGATYSALSEIYGWTSSGALIMTSFQRPDLRIPEGISGNAMWRTPGAFEYFVVGQGGTIHRKVR